MKKIFNLFTKLVPCTLVMLLVAHTAYGQCPTGETEIEVTYTAGGFNGENSWVLWDATAGAEVLCGGINPAAGTSAACVTDGNAIELHTFETFGDGWCPPANISVTLTEDGSVSGCLLPLAGNATPVTPTIYDGDGGASGNGSYACGAGAPAGVVAVSFMTLCSPCVPTCPDDIVTQTDPGTCEATVEIPLPTLPAGCEIVGFPASVMELAAGATFPHVYEVDPNQSIFALDLFDTPFSTTGVAPIDPTLTCVSEVIVTVDSQGDFGAGFENTPLLGEDGTTVVGIVGGVECAPNTQDFVLDRALYDAWAADGQIDWLLQGNPGVNPYCNGGAGPFTIAASISAATECAPFVIDGMAAAGSGATTTNPITFPGGETTTVTLIGTGSGSGVEFPIICEVDVTVQDLEPPVLNCPSNFTFNLQGGECEVIYDFEVTSTDNCQDMGGTQSDSSTFGDIFNCPGSGFAVTCANQGTGERFPTGLTQELDVTPLNGEWNIEEGCFVFDNAAWQGDLATVNFYVAPAGLTASGLPLPNFLTATPVATSGEVSMLALGGVNGEGLCVPMQAPYVLTDNSVGLYMEILSAGGVGNGFGQVAWAGATCNGITADGTNTYLSSLECGSGYYAGFGFTTDVFYTFKATQTSLGGDPDPSNDFASGASLPIGEHPFMFTVTDDSGNTASCEWTVTVNGVPEDQIVTSLACNDLVNVSLDEECNIFISPDMFLEGGPYDCYFDGRYAVYLSGYQNGAVDITGLTLNNVDPGLYTVTVVDTETNNSCWGEVLVEDKIAPDFPVTDFSVSCKDADIPEFLTAVALPADLDLTTDVAGVTIGEGGLSQPAMDIPFEVSLGCTGESVVNDVNFGLSLTHTFMADIEISLISPAGTVVNLIFDECGGSDDLNVVFDDQGIPFGCDDATRTGGLNVTAPDGLLSTFNGESVEGTWILRYADDAGGDEGEFVSASISFNNGEVECGLITASQYLDANASACQIVDLEVIQVEAFGNECDGESVVRTWIATDAAGNQTTKLQTITRDRIGVADLGTEWFWPTDQVFLTCDADPSPEAIYAYFRGLFEAANPCPLPTCDPNDGHNYDPGFVATWECAANSAGVINAYPQCFNDEKNTFESFYENACNVFFTYTDQYLSVCGSGCDGNSKIIRTWTALDWCTGETDNSGVQVIHAKDTEGPTMQPFGGPVTVSANPWGCAADYRFPAPVHLADNCSDVVTWRVYGEPGQVPNSDDIIIDGPKMLTDFDGNVVLDENGHPIWVVENLPKAMTPYTFTYELSDCCGNLNTYTLQVVVVDNNTPSAQVKQNIVISLTSSPTDPNSGSAKLYASSVDNGSHDGDCGPVRIAIRRLDAMEDADDDDVEGLCANIGDRDHNNNRTFFNFNDLPNQGSEIGQGNGHNRNDTDEGLFVKFCCEDFTLEDNDYRTGVDEDGDGVNDYVLIDVELGVWDDANMDGVPGTIGDLFNVTWATIRVEAKLAPSITCPPLAKITCDMDEKDLSMTGSAFASSTCGALDVVYEDLCGLDINQDGEITEFTVTDPAGMLINEVGMCTDVNRDGIIANYTAPWWSTVDEDLYNKACHYGPITRWWSIDGTDVKCRQIIVVERPLSVQQFDGTTSIDWPYSEDEFIELEDNDGDNCGLMEVGSGDIEQYNVLGEPISGNDIPTYAEVRLSCVDGLCDEPVWVDATCSLIGWTLDSDTFFFEGDACRKIINTYTVIDWCQYIPNDPNSSGIWTWTVIGKLLDTEAPVVEARDSMFAALPGQGGSGTDLNNQSCVGVGISMPAVAYDTNLDSDGNVIDNACPSEWLKWNVYLDINNDWRFEREWSSFVPQDQGLPFDPLWSEDNAADNLAVYGYLIPDVRVGNKIDRQNPVVVDNARDGTGFNDASYPATAPNFEYVINIPDAIPADCGETTHRVVWKVYDGCGNVSSTTSYFTVQDKKAPTPYCINLSTALMADPDGAGPQGPMVELWAIDFDRGSFDNCVAYEDLRFTFSDVAPENDPDYNPALRSSAKVFTCEYLNGATSATITQGVYVWDLCGNYDFCQVNLRLVDNNGDNGCGGTGSGTGSIAGKVITEFGDEVENVEVMNMEMISEYERMDMTASTGDYMFENNTLEMDYQLSASKDGDYLNGVSTLDLVMIQRHILGLESLDSPYKLIAADANNDGQVSAIDLIELRKLILGIYDELPSNSSWRFADASQTIDINNPWNFNDKIDIYGLTGDLLDKDFVAIKIGDVNESVIASATSGTSEVRSPATVTIDFEDKVVEPGQTVELVVNAENFNNVYGYQFTLDAKGLELVNVKSAAINVSEENFASIGNAVTTSWNTLESVNASGELFTMTFKANTSGNLSDIINITSDVTKAEAYVGSDLDIVDIALNNTTTEAAAEFALMNNEPNPFTTNTIIGFVLPQAADAKISVLDVTGRVIMTVDGNYAEGYNEIELSKSDLGAAGVYYYQLDSGDFTATKKMIIIE